MSRADAFIDYADSKWNVQKGDIYEIREKDSDRVHLLICGDCTNEDDIAAIVERDSVAAIIADPPYNVQYISAGAPDRKTYCDKYTDFEYHAFLLKGLRLWKSYTMLFWRHLGIKGMIRE